MMTTRGPSNPVASLLAPFEVKLWMVELDSNLSTWLNGDWKQTLLLRHFCARVFEGMVFIEKLRPYL